MSYHSSLYISISIIKYYKNNGSKIYKARDYNSRYHRVIKVVSILNMCYDFMM